MECSAALRLRAVFLSLLTGLAMSIAPLAQAQESVTIGVLIDGPDELANAQLPAIQREMVDLLRPDVEPLFPQAKQLDGDWRLAGVRAGLARLLADDEVDLIITLGLVASHEASRIDNLPKPVIAARVADAILQDFPFVTGVSGKANFTYVTSLREVEQDLESFYRISPFEHLAVLVDALTLESIPELRQRAKATETAFSVSVDVIPVTDSAADALTRLPARVDAVYVTPLNRLSSAEMRGLADGLIARRLPSFSLLGRSQVEEGLMLATGGGSEDLTRYARRIALMAQRILLGEPASALEVALPQAERVSINMRSARAIGFLPRWSVLVDAIRIDDVEPDQGEAFSLIGAMLDAVDRNLGLRADELDVRIAEDTVDQARSGLLPQVSSSLSRTQIDGDRAAPGLAAERTTDATIEVSQVIYAEEVRAGFVVSRFLRDSQDHAYRARVLDVLQLAANAYLNVLRAKALERVRASNLEVTRTNFELARTRERIGISGRGDVLRWESELASDKRDLLAAEADRRAAEVELSRVLNRPQQIALATTDAGTQGPLQALEDPRFTRFIDNPIVWETFQEYVVEDALRQAPELAQFDALESAQERDLLAQKRSFYIPSVTVGGSGSSNLGRGGRGSDFAGAGLDDESWNVGVQLSLPLFAGGARRAARSQSAHALDQIQTQRADLAQSVEARARAALKQTGGSYPAIELSGDAARAAAENLELIADAYSQGAVSITDLVNAQDAALAANLAQAEARYAFLLDYVELIRASGSFESVLSQEGLEAWFARLAQYFADRGVQPLAPERPR
ncbi:MAG: TolC family protein [Pseudomonadota bacterium]